MGENKKLVALVQKRREIYDHSLEDHSNKTLIINAWNEIAKEMNSTAFDCKRKWATLRSSYARYLRAGNVTANGSARQTTWYLSEAMKFLDKHIISSPRSVPLERRSRSESTALLNKINEKQEDISLMYESSDENSMTYQTSLPRSPAMKKSKKISATAESIASPLIEYLRSETEGKKIEDDSDSLFFKSMLADYKILTSKRKRYFRELMVTVMNKHQEDEEIDQAELNVCRCRRDIE